MGFWHHELVKGGGNDLPVAQVLRREADVFKLEKRHEGDYGSW